MPRLTEDQWAECRKLRESTGLSYANLGERFGVSDVAVMKQAKKESWGDGANANEVANKLALERANGIVPDLHQNFAERAKSIDGAANKKAEVLLRHQADWDRHRDNYPCTVVEENPDTGEMIVRALNGEELKRAKLAAEMLRLRHEGERRAFGITDGLGGDGAPQGKSLSDF